MTAVEPQYALIGRRLRTEREKRNLTQAYVAERLGLPRSGISNIEKGKQRLLLHTFLEYASAIDMSPVELLKELQVAPAGGRLQNVALDSKIAMTDREEATILRVVYAGADST